LVDVNAGDGCPGCVERFDDGFSDEIGAAGHEDMSALETESGVHDDDDGGSGLGVLEG
jgi:hypothetical protein